MRLKIFGIPKILLIFLGLLPTFFWCVFHQSAVSFHERSFLIFLAGGAMVAAFFTYFFSRGFFGVRFGILFFSIVIVGDAFISSMLDRDFPKLGLALLVFFPGVAISFWLEKRVQSADLNPKLEWFEGDPKLMPQIEARVKVGEDWAEGKIRAIDRDGFFIFLMNSVKLSRQTPVEFELKFKGEAVQGHGRLNAQFYGPRSGFGLQFFPKDLYHFSQYTALVERLKGEGL